MQNLNNKDKFIETLNQRYLLNELTEMNKQFNEKITNHFEFVNKNARPNISVKSEIDKFRGFLRDVVSYEPDYILTPPKPRLHYFN